MIRKANLRRERGFKVCSLLLIQQQFYLIVNIWVATVHCVTTVLFYSVSFEKLVDCVVESPRGTHTTLTYTEGQNGENRYSRGQVNSAMCKL